MSESIARALSLIATQSRAYYDAAIRRNDSTAHQYKSIIDEATEPLREYCFDQGKPMVDACDLAQDNRPDYSNVFTCRTCLMVWVKTDSYKMGWYSGDWHGAYPWLPMERTL
jgi:hypothetical protein